VEVVDQKRLRIHPPASADTVSSYSIGRWFHYRFRLGNADFFFLDTRSHRNLHDVTKPDKPGISMLGESQKKWLLDGMKGSDAEFFFVVSSVNFMIPHGSSKNPRNKDDAWTSFAQEREELIRFWESLKRPVFVLTGDIHMSYTVKISDLIWEVASGPHNSPHHVVGDKGYPPNGPFDSRGRICDVRWTTYLANDSTEEQRRWQKVYTVIDVRNVFNNPNEAGKDRWTKWIRPHVIIQHFDGLSGELLYSETVHGVERNIRY
jgi:hypothetical protein